MINSELDILVWPDNTQCYRKDLDEYSWMSDDYLVVVYGSFFYPDNITIFEVDYDKVVATRLAMLGMVNYVKSISTDYE